MFAISAPATDTLLVVISALVGIFIALGFAEKVPNTRMAFRLPGVSALIQSRVIVICGFGLAAVVALLITGLIVGDFPIGAWDALGEAFWARGGEFDFIVNTLRFPRVTTAILAGMCLGMSGAIFQALINNPLVSPDIIGINTGAAVFAVFILAAGRGVEFLPIAAFGGAVGTAAIIYLLAWKRGVSGSRLVLVGVGIQSLLGAVITFITVRFPIERVAAAARWQAGSLFGASWDDVRTLVIGLLLLTPTAFVLTQRLRLLQLGDEAAAGLGIRVERDRLALIVVASGMAAVAVAVIGPLGFVALLVPHMVRLMVGQLTGGTLLLTAIVGAAFLLGADLIAQRLFAPTVLPAGVVTGAIGGPYFLFLLARYNRAL
ncbi:MAG: iron ABC transporter permease [Actinomycetota bacterium]